MLLICLTFVACDKEPDLPTGANPEYFAKCVSNEEAAALGFEKKCSPPGCVCLQDVHGEEPRLEAHCHSNALKCN